MFLVVPCNFQIFFVFSLYVQVDVCIVMDNYHYRDARKSPWMQVARDRMRFGHRIQKCEIDLKPLIPNKLERINDLNNTGINSNDVHLLIHVDNQSEACEVI